MENVFKRAGSNRHRFCRNKGHNYQTLQAYWNSDKLPPGKVLEDLAKEFNVSLDALVLGRNTLEIPVDNPILARIIRFLVQQDAEELSRIDEVLRMHQAATRSEPPALIADELSARPKQKESLAEQLMLLARQVESSRMTPEDKEGTKELLNRIVRNIYTRELEIDDEWAVLEEIE
jgi:hypothetical protein